MGLAVHFHHKLQRSLQMTNQIVALHIDNVEIRQDAEGRYCLNDLHRAAGGEKRHQPSDWFRLTQTQDLVVEVEKSIPGIPGIQSKQGLGTFVVKELVYAYAMWISPAFHLKVIRTFDAARRPMSPAEILIHQGQIMLTLEREQARQAEAQRALEVRQTATEQRLAQMETAQDHFTIIGWCRLVGRGSIPLTDAAKMGAKATAFCKNSDITMGQVPDQRFGKANTYPKWVLDSLFGDIAAAA
jgi:hypothetical protein